MRIVALLWMVGCAPPPPDDLPSIEVPSVWEPVLPVEIGEVTAASASAVTLRVPDGSVDAVATDAEARLVLAKFVPEGRLTGAGEVLSRWERDGRKLSLSVRPGVNEVVASWSWVEVQVGP